MDLTWSTEHGRALVSMEDALRRLAQNKELSEATRLRADHALSATRQLRKIARKRRPTAAEVENLCVLLAALFVLGGRILRGDTEADILALAEASAILGCAAAIAKLRKAGRLPPSPPQ